MESMMPELLTHATRPQSIQRILVIKLRAVGDVQLATAVLPNLRRAFPTATIDFLTETPCDTILDGNPYINSVVVFRPKKDQIFTLFRSLYRRKYNIVFDLFSNPRSAQLTFASRAGLRVGYAFRGRKYAYNMLVNPRGAEVHNVEFNLDALRRLDIPIVEKTILFPLTDEQRSYAFSAFRKMFLSKALIIGLNPGTNRPTEKWPAANFASLGRMLRDRLHAHLLVFWGPGELELARSIQEQIGEHSYIAPPTSLKLLGAFFEQCSAVVSNDSGPMHIAAALGVPTVGLFGPVNPKLQGPYGKRVSFVTKQELGCLGCNLDKSCVIGNLCMTELDPEFVFLSVRNLLNQD